MSNETLDVINIERTKIVKFSFDGKIVQGFNGETIAAALLRAGIRKIRSAPNSNRSSNSGRGLFCMMGSCQECLIIGDGKRAEACRTPIYDGMVVEQVKYV